MKVLLAAVLATAGCGVPEEQAEPEMVVEVTMAKATVEDVEATLAAAAAIHPKSEAKIASQLTAPIVRLDVGKGDRVSKGQTLAWLQRQDLEAQLAEAQAQVTDAEAALEKASVGTQPIDLVRARAEVERTQAALAEAEQIYERRKTLVAEGALPERDLLLARTRYEQARTDRRVAGADLERLQGQSGMQDVRMAESRVAQARARREQVEAQLGFAEIRSPTAGVITEQFLYAGDMTGPAAPIFTVMDLSSAVARAQFPEEEVAALDEGQRCRFEGIDGGGGESYAGVVTVVNQAVDPARRTVEVWCEIPNRNQALKAGAFGRVIVLVGVHKDAVTVPAAAVEFDSDRSGGVVWTVGADGTAHENRVEPGVVSGDRIEIVKGLAGGESVVVEGGYGLSDGVAVRAAEPRP